MRKKEYYCSKLNKWYKEARKEAGPWSYFWKKRLRGGAKKDYGIYPRRYWQNPILAQKKSVNYCFIGGYSTDEKTLAARQWLIGFIKNKFDVNSYLQFTDRKTKSGYKPLGEYDFTLERTGLVPKELPEEQWNNFDENYFTMMAKSQFVLCPAGDAPWSMRFYESLMCKAIPIVEVKEHSYRSLAEAELGYKFYLPDENHVYREDWVEYNYQIFLQHHTF